MFIICTIAVAMISGGSPTLRSMDVEGRVLKETATSYVADFSEGMKRFSPLSSADLSVYSRILVDKSTCIVEE